MDDSRAAGPRPRAVVTRRRLAGAEHEVVSVEVKGGQGLYRRRPCAGCPWRCDQVGVFPAEAFRLSANIAYDAAISSFACHESGLDRSAICAGFLLRNAAHNLVVRLKLRLGLIDPAKLSDGGHRLFTSYREMAIANGVDPADPVLRRCRANTPDWRRDLAAFPTNPAEV